MNTILLAHAARYPQMEPRDAVKLIYQNEFGGGHLISDEQACMDYLNREYASVFQQADADLLEEIGNGLVRVNLAALDACFLPVAELGAAFLRSAAIHQGNRESFRKKLTVLRTLTRDGHMPFSETALETYLADYEKAGFPAVSHSEIYRNVYHPAYRVVRKEDLPMQVL